MSRAIVPKPVLPSSMDTQKTNLLATKRKMGHEGKVKKSIEFFKNLYMNN